MFRWRAHHLTGSHGRTVAPNCGAFMADSGSRIQIAVAEGRDFIMYARIAMIKALGKS